MRQLRRGLRATRYILNRLRSYLVLLWYKSLYANLDVGRGVTVDRGVTVLVSNDGILRIGDGVHIQANCHVIAKGRLTLGARSFVGTGTMIVASEAIDIGADALIAAYVTIRDQDHGFADAHTPYSQQQSKASPITIEDNVWLGTHVTVLKGVRIGSGSIIGANSVVTRDVATLSLCAGVPAKVIKTLATPETSPA